MNKRTGGFRILILKMASLATLVALSGCSKESTDYLERTSPPEKLTRADDDRTQGEQAAPKQGEVSTSSASPSLAGLARFTSETEFNDYMTDLVQKGPGQHRAPRRSAQSALDASNQAATNRQEPQVDEGGIVKNIGDHFVTLRKGRLYAVSVAEPGKPVQSDTIAVAGHPDLNRGIWYDEMIVKGTLVYVLGYRYDVKVEGEDGHEMNGVSGATEVNTFRLEGGHFVRLGAFFVEANDYYSSSNYTSRLINGELIFYMPYYGLRAVDDHYVPRIPRFLKHKSGHQFIADKPLFHPTDVAKPLTLPKSPTFHTIMRCQLPENGTFVCKARAALGDSGREHYVTKDRMYIWTTNYLYTFSFKDEQQLVHKIEGYPIDQFSFKEDQDKLHVVTILPQTQAETPVASLKVTTLELAKFDAQGEQNLAALKSMTLIDKAKYFSPSANRIIGNTVMASVQDHEGAKFFVYDLVKAQVFQESRKAQAERIEPIATDRVLVVAAQQTSPKESRDLLLEVWQPSTHKVLSSWHLSKAMQGETRSHGFFLKPDSDGWIIGLPMLKADQKLSKSLATGGIANIMFQRISAQGVLQNLGVIAAAEHEPVRCEGSCLDWYGNTRPLFLGERIFALMGHEFQELRLSGERMERDGLTLWLHAS